MPRILLIEVHSSSFWPVFEKHWVIYLRFGILRRELSIKVIEDRCIFPRMLLLGIQFLSSRRMCEIGVPMPSICQFSRFGDDVKWTRYSLSMLSVWNEKLSFMWEFLSILGSVLRILVGRQRLVCASLSLQSVEMAAQSFPLILIQNSDHWLAIIDCHNVFKLSM